MRDAPRPGVYLLFLKQRLTYVGRSKNPPKRIDVHRKNGRSFDYAVHVECPSEDVAWIERALIEALNPPQNVLGATPREIPDDPPEQGRAPPSPPPQEPSWYVPPPLMSRSAARDMAKRHGFQFGFEAAVASGELPCRPKNPARAEPHHPHVVRRADIEAWIELQTAAHLEAQRTSGYRLERTNHHD